ncbi:MAG: hypothetical protein AAF355_12275 [Myxococcota bacterium]
MKRKQRTSIQRVVPAAMMQVAGVPVGLAFALLSAWALDRATRPHSRASHKSKARMSAFGGTTSRPSIFG